MKICLETFGCRLNRAEALADEARYLAAGHIRTESHVDADIIVVRGCSVTARAQKDCEKLIAHLKRKYPKKQVLVTGCLKDAKPLLAPHLRANTPPPVPTRTSRAYLKVQDGCDAQCAFCIVPQFRGKSVSKEFTAALDEAKRFADAGYHEIVVTGCNLAQYLSAGRRLPDIISALADLAPDVRVRIGSVEPGACAREVISVMAERTNVCRFLHLPIQTGSDTLLRAMKRPYTGKETESLVNDAVRAMPTLGLGCDLMTGFPGETERDQLLTKSLVERHPFSNAHVFPYSERPDTAAAKMPGAVQKAVRSRRAHELSELVSRKREIYARSFVGRTVEVVVENEEHAVGWTGEYLPCKVLRRGNGAAIRRKDLVSARVTNWQDGRLVAVQCG